MYVSGQPLTSGGVLLDITDNGVGISDQEMSHANWRLDNPPVVDVAVSRRMGLFVVGRLAARHGVRVRLRHAQAGGLTALIWLPDTVAAPEVAPPLGRLRRFEADDYGPTPSLSAPTATAPGSSAASQATAAARIPQVLAVRALGPLGTGRSRGAVLHPRGERRRAGLPGGSRGSPVRGLAHPASRTSRRRGHPGRQQLGAGRQRLGPGQRPGHARIARTGRRPRRCRSATATATRSARLRRDQGDQGMTPSRGPRRPAARAGSLPSAERSASVRRRRRARRARSSPSAARTSTAATARARAARRTATAGPGPGDAGRRSGDRPAGRAGAAAADLRLAGVRLVPAQRDDHDRPAAGAGQLGRPASRPARRSWTSPADEGWRAAQVVASPAAGETTQAGLPRRVPRANLVPGSVGSGGQGSQDAVAEAPARSADAVRSRMSSFQRGVREGRAAAPQIEEP